MAAGGAPLANSKVSAAATAMPPAANASCRRIRSARNPPQTMPAALPSMYTVSAPAARVSGTS